MVIERNRELTKQRAERLQNPKTFIVSSRSSVLPDILNDYILESLKRSEEQLKMKEYLFGAPKYVVSGEYIPFDDIAIRFNPSYTFEWAIGPIENNKVCKLQTEETKMDAKKCERCGKLYEMKDAADCVRTYLPGLPVSDYDKENFTESRIKRDHSTAICIVKKPGNEVADLCPQCREMLRNFFESGEEVGINETNVIKKAEE